MADLDEDFPFEDEEQNVADSEYEAALSRIYSRCEKSSISIETKESELGDSSYVLKFPCARETRDVRLWTREEVVAFDKLEFEKFCFLSGLVAICSYEDGVIEVGLKHAEQIVPPSALYRRLFRTGWSGIGDEENSITVRDDQEGSTINIGVATSEFKALAGLRGSMQLSLRITGLDLARHDDALRKLNRLASSFLFQLELLVKLPLVMHRLRNRGRTNGKLPVIDKTMFTYPSTEFDSSPMALYWYGRSAGEMPLLQFLAFYQVIEFYFPVYSQAEAQRKIKGILKDPTFRGDRDADVARLLHTIQINKSGNYGDERSQLRSTVLECVDASDLRNFISGDKVLEEFFAGGGKGLRAQKISYNNPHLDLRGEISDRIYDIRCRIVHTKSDIRDGGSELLLPYSKEAESLAADIQIVQYVAQRVLVMGSRHIVKD